MFLPSCRDCLKKAATMPQATRFPPEFGSICRSGHLGSPRWDADCWTKRGPNRLCLSLVALSLLLWFAAAGIARAQTAATPGPVGDASISGRGGPQDTDNVTSNPRLMESLEARRNVERQKQLEADTQKLFLLAQQLKEEVAKSNKDQLSVAVVKKSEEIEKLAKSVKEKMRGY